MKGISEEWLKYFLIVMENNIDRPGMEQAVITFKTLLDHCYELNIWKPIDDNTPKDRPILLLTEYDVMVEGYFVDLDGGYWVDGMNHDEIKPKAWQYLPTLPKEKL